MFQKAKSRISLESCIFLLFTFWDGAVQHNCGAYLSSLLCVQYHQVVAGSGFYLSSANFRNSHLCLHLAIYSYLLFDDCPYEGVLSYFPISLDSLSGVPILSTGATLSDRNSSASLYLSTRFFCARTMRKSLVKKVFRMAFENCHN